MWEISAVTSFLYLFYLLCLAQPLAPGLYPHISESFVAEIHLSYQNVPGQYTSTGEGHVGRDYPNGKQLINLNLLKYGEYDSIYYQLKLYDSRIEFVITESPRREKYCYPQRIDSFDEVWGWLKQAKHNRVKIDGHIYDEWNSTDNSLSVLLNETHHRTPVRYIANYTDKITIVDFKSFIPRPPKDPDEFIVPKICISPVPSVPED